MQYKSFNKNVKPFRVSSKESADNRYSEAIKKGTKGIKEKSFFNCTSSVRCAYTFVRNQSKWTFLKKALNGRLKQRNGYCKTAQNLILPIIQSSSVANLD